MAAKAQCSIALQPTFGLNFNGTFVANINNGFPDPGESAGITLCDGGQYYTSDISQSNPGNLYDIKYASSGGLLVFDGHQIFAGVISAEVLTSTAGLHTMGLVNPDVAGTLIQTITPFTDLNNNGLLDAGDCAGDAIQFTYTCTPASTWYLDADGDQHASQTIRSCSNPGTGWTLTELPLDDCNDNDPGPCPNQPPVVEITNPVSGTNYVVLREVTLRAEASDADGAIKSVDFYYNGSTLIFTERKAPYSRKWYPPATGSYYLTAVATDNKGVKTTSAPVHITVVHDRPPVVNITSPADGAIYAAPANLVLSADATGHGAKIKNVEFYNGTMLLHTEFKFPYSWNWKNVASGNYVLTAIAKDIYNRNTTSAAVHVMVTSPQCSTSDKPVFGFNFNGTSVANINNGVPDPGEAAGLSVCEGSQYFTSGHFNGSSSNLYNITDVASGGTLLFNGDTDNDRVITAAELAASAGTYTITLATPGTGGTLVQTITPFTDLNNNGILDANDCSGDPIVFTYTVAPKPTFSFNFNGTIVSNNAPGASAGISVCDGGQYFTSGHFNSSSSNLYQITYQQSGGTLLFSGYEVFPTVLTAEELTATAGEYTITLADPNTAGSLIQTIIPFTDVNSNGIIDENDCSGEPIIFTYTASSKPTFSFNFNGTVVSNTAPGASASVTVCSGDQYFTSGHVNSSPDNLYNITDVASGGVLLFNGSTDYNRVITAAELSATAGTYAITLADPATGGTLIQTITPFLDVNKNGELDAADCSNNAVSYTYTAFPCGNRNSLVSVAPLRVNGKRFLEKMISLQLLPNPAHNILTVLTSEFQNARACTISVISASGVIMKTVRKGGSAAIRLDISSLANGVYFIRLNDGEKNTYKQFVKM